MEHWLCESCMKEMDEDDKCFAYKPDFGSICEDCYCQFTEEDKPE